MMYYCSVFFSNYVIGNYKSKDDIQSCNNYRDIKLLSHNMKVWERVGDGGKERSVHFN